MNYLRSTVIDIWHHLRGILSGRWLRRNGETPPPPLPIIDDDGADIADDDLVHDEPIPEIDLPPVPKKRRRKGGDDTGGWDDYAFHFRRDLLDQLDTYFDALRMMRRADYGAYKLYAQVGAHMMPNYRWAEDIRTLRFGDNERALSPWWRDNRPGFGAVAFGVCRNVIDTEKKEDKIFPRFLYFTKYKQDMAPPEVQRVGGAWDVYVVSVYWDIRWTKGRVKGKRWSFVTQFPMAIDPSGNLHPLKTKMRKVTKVRSKKYGGTTSIPQVVWGHDEMLIDWAAEYKVTPEIQLSRLFACAANEFEISNLAMARVMVTNKSGLTGVFGVDPRRCAYFFKDRDITLNDAGSRKRVFHIVRPHARLTKKGESTVKMHFRGERSFKWGNYGVLVTIPGLHHVSLAEFSIGAYDGEAVTIDKDLVEQDEMGRRLRLHIQGVKQHDHH